MLCGELAVNQAPMFDGFSFDPFTLFDNDWNAAEVGIGGRNVVQALVVWAAVVVGVTSRFVRQTTISRPNCGFRGDRAQCSENYPRTSELEWRASP